MYGQHHGTEITLSVWKLRAAGLLDCCACSRFSMPQGWIRCFSQLNFHFARSVGADTWDKAVLQSAFPRWVLEGAKNTAAETCACLSFGSVLLGSILFYVSHTWYHFEPSASAVPRDTTPSTSQVCCNRHQWIFFKCTFVSGFAAQFQMSPPSCDNETGKGQSRNSKGDERSEIQSIHTPKGVRPSLLW